MEFVVTEIDSQENKKMQALMGELAALGEIAYPPAAPILAVLNNLGGALLKGNKDDVLMRYQVGFDIYGQGLDAYIPRLGLREGYYVFVREETRTNTTPWKELKVNLQQGIVEKDDKLFRDRTWLLVRIARETDESTLDQAIGQKLGEFQKNLESMEASSVPEELGKLKQHVKTLVNGSSGK
jgi:hypothetical protein